MNSPTTRCTTPAAVPRTGRGESALPRPDPGAKTQSLPFAALPHDAEEGPEPAGEAHRRSLAAALLGVCMRAGFVLPTNAHLAVGPGCSESDDPSQSGALQQRGLGPGRVGAHQPNGRTHLALLAGGGFPWSDPGGSPGQVPDPRRSTGTPPPAGWMVTASPVGGKEVRRRGESEERNVTDSLPPPDHQSAVPLVPLPHPISPPPRRGWSPPLPRPRCPPQAPRRSWPQPTGPSTRPAQGRAEGPSRSVPGPGPAECLAVGSSSLGYRIGGIFHQRAWHDRPGLGPGRAASGGVHGCRSVAGQGA